MVIHLASLFIDTIMPSKVYVGVHWRYNEGDFIGSGSLRGEDTTLNFRNLGNEFSLHLKLVTLKPMHLIDVLIDYGVFFFKCRILG